MTQILKPTSLQPLKYDRTNEKLRNIRKDKETLLQYPATIPETQYDSNSEDGSFSYKTMNRIEEWVQWLGKVANDAGYGQKVAPITGPYTENSIIYLEDIDRIRNEITSIKEGFYDIPNWRNLTHDPFITLDQANAIEWDLQLLSEYIDLLCNFRTCVIESGQSNIETNSVSFFKQQSGSGGIYDNGLTWHIATTPGNRTLGLPISYAKNKFYTPESFYGNNTLTSTDGIHWLRDRSIGYTLLNVVELKGVLIGLPHNFDGGGIVYSEDGVTWQYSNYGIGTSPATEVFYNDTVALTSISTNGTIQLYYTQDGKTWEPCKKNGNNVRLNYQAYRQCILYSNGLWLCIDDNAAMYSVDGISWKDCTGVYNITQNYVVRSLKNHYIIFEPAGSNNIICTSTDGKHFTEAQAPTLNNPTERLYDAHYANNLYVFATVYKQQQHNYYSLYYSYNGSTWHESNIYAYGIDTSNIKYANGRWLAGGGQLASTDGKTWVRTNLTQAGTEPLFAKNIWVTTNRQINGIPYSEG